MTTDSTTKCNCKCLKNNQHSSTRSALTHQQLFDEFSTRVTLHGFRFLFNGNGLRRIVWFIICTGVFTFSMFLSYGLLQDFFNRKMNTGVTRTYTESVLDFPTVTVCPLNTLSSNKLHNLPLDYTIEDFLQVKNDLIFNNVPKDSRQILAQELHDVGIDSIFSLYDLYQLSFNEITKTDVLKSIFGDQPCSFYGTECNTSWFTKRLNWGHDLCFQFNAYRPGKESLKAPLRVEGYFNHGLVLYFDLGAADQTQNLHIVPGLLVIIENYGNRDDMLILNEKISVEPGKSTHIKVTEKEFKMLPSPYSTHCGTRSLEFIDPQIRYSQGICVIDCIIGHIFNKCSCVGEEYSTLVRQGISMCKLEEEFCHFNTQAKIIESELYKTCFDSCPNECIRKSFDIKKSTMKIGTCSQYQHLIENVEKFRNKTAQEVEYYVNNYVMTMSVSFFDNMVISEEMQPSVTWESLIATLGGAIGLGLGFSFITGFEFLFFFFDVIKLAWQRRQQKLKEARKTRKKMDIGKQNESIAIQDLG